MALTLSNLSIETAIAQRKELDALRAWLQGTFAEQPYKFPRRRLPACIEIARVDGQTMFTRMEPRIRP